MRDRLLAMVAELRRNYTFIAALQEAEVKANLRMIAAHIPPGATLALVLPSCWQFDLSPNQRNTNHARWCVEELGGRPNIHLIDIDRSIHAQTDRSADMGDHFDRIVYYRVAEDIMSRATLPVEAKAAE